MGVVVLSKITYSSTGWHASWRHRPNSGRRTEPQMRELCRPSLAPILIRIDDPRHVLCFHFVQMFCIFFVEIPCPLEAGEHIPNIETTYP